MGGAASTVSQLQLAKSDDACELSEVGVKAELAELTATIARMESAICVLRPIMTDGSLDERSMIIEARRAIRKVVNGDVPASASKPTESESAQTKLTPSPIADKPLEKTSIPHSIMQDGIGVTASIDRVHVHWEEWWKPLSEKTQGQPPAGGFRILLRPHADDQGDVASDRSKWIGFFQSDEVCGSGNSKVVRPKGGLSRGGAYDFSIHAMGDDKSQPIHKSPIITVATMDITVENVCAVPGAHHMDVWWHYNHPPADVAVAVKFMILIRKKMDQSRGESNDSPWFFVDVNELPTAEAPMRIAKTFIEPEVCYEIKVRYEVPGQKVETAAIDVVTLSGGPTPSDLRVTGLHDSFTISWQYPKDATCTKFLVCARDAAAADAQWGYLACDQVHTEENPFTYAVDGGLIPETTYAVYIEAEQSDGTTTASEATTVFTDARGHSKKIAQNDESLLQRQREATQKVGSQKQSLLAARLAKRREKKKSAAGV